MSKPRPEEAAVDTCRACGAAMNQGDVAGDDVRLARCEHCGYGRKRARSGESPLELAIDVGDREPSTPASWLLEQLPPATRNADRLDVLDIGCWDGALLAGLSQRWRRRGLEPNPAAAERARVAGLDVVTTSLEDWPGEPMSCDLVIMLDVLEHMDSPRASMTKVHELLRPSGLFAALTGDGASLGARVFGPNWYYAQYAEHIGFFTRQSIESMLTGLGFEVTVGRIGHPMSGHLVDGVKLASRIRSRITGDRSTPDTSALGVGLNLQTASRLLRGRDHLWVIARKRDSDAEHP